MDPIPERNPHADVCAGAQARRRARSARAREPRHHGGAPTVEEQKRERIAERRLRGGSRFNIRFEDRVPHRMLPEDVMAALAEYVDFGDRPPSRGVVPATTGDISLVRKGLSRGPFWSRHWSSMSRINELRPSS
jgi:hypothetical protein